MASPILNLRLRRFYSKFKRTNISGFTLLELLVAMLVSGIIVSGLLFLVVELLKIDRREAVLDQTQRDMQRAMDYVVDDIREAVYIYDDPSTIVPQITDSPGGVSYPSVLASRYN